MGEEMEDKFEQVFSQCGQTSHVYFQCSSLLFCEHDPVNGSKTTKSHLSHDFIVPRQIKQTCQYNGHASVDDRNKQLQQPDIYVIDMVIF